MCCLPPPPRKPRLHRADGRWNCTFRLTTVTVVGHGDTPAAAWADMNRAICNWKLK